MKRNVNISLPAFLRSSNMYYNKQKKKKRCCFLIQKMKKKNQLMSIKTALALQEMKLCYYNTHYQILIQLLSKGVHKVNMLLCTVSPCKHIMHVQCGYKINQFIFMNETFSLFVVSCFVSLSLDYCIQALSVLELF